MYRLTPILFGLVGLIAPAHAGFAQSVVDDLPSSAWQVRNPAGGLSARVSATAVELEGLPDAERPWRLRMYLESWGRGEHQEPPGGARPRATEHRLDLDRGVLTEWYVNDERGLEQGFTIARAPASATAGPLRLVLALEGDFTVRVLDGGRDAVLTSPDTALSYGGLVAWDATARELEARLVPAAGGIAIEVDDTDAVYPVTIDPWIATQTATLTATVPDPHDWFGWSVALDGDTALASAPGDDDLDVDAGAAYVFTRAGSSWQLQEKLLAANASYYEQMGQEVALEGDTAALLGSSLFVGGLRVLVFSRSGTSWTQEAELSPATLDLGFGFTYGLALSGDTIAVGSRWFDVGTLIAYETVEVFARTGGAWAREAILFSPCSELNAGFGHSLSLEGDTLLVACGGEDVAGEVDAGAFYVFTRSGTSWTEEARITAVEPEAGARFGGGVSLHGDEALIAASLEDVGDVADAGAVYVFEGNGSAWTRQARITADDPGNMDGFGSPVVLDGDLALVGADGDDDMGHNAGAAYLLARGGAGWRLSTKVVSSDGWPRDAFGSAADLDGDALLVGALIDDHVNGTETNEGSAHVFALTPVAHVHARDSIHNLPTYTATSPPVLGGSYDGYVWFGVWGDQDTAILVGYASPVTIQLSHGPVLLVNVADPAGELLGMPVISGSGYGQVPFSLPVPNDPRLAGFEVFTQALLLGPGSFHFSNAQDLFVGF